MNFRTPKDGVHRESPFFSIIAKPFAFVRVYGIFSLFRTGRNITEDGEKTLLLVECRTNECPLAYVDSCDTLSWFGFGGRRGCCGLRESVHSCTLQIETKNYHVTCKTFVIGILRTSCLRDHGGSNVRTTWRCWRRRRTRWLWRTADADSL